MKNLITFLVFVTFVALTLPNKGIVLSADGSVVNKGIVMRNTDGSFKGQGLTFDVPTAPPAPPDMTPAMTTMSYYGSVLYVIDWRTGTNATIDAASGFKLAGVSKNIVGGMTVNNLTLVNLSVFPANQSWTSSVINLKTDGRRGIRNWLLIYGTNVNGVGITNGANFLVSPP